MARAEALPKQQPHTESETNKPTQSAQARGYGVQVSWGEDMGLPTPGPN